MASRKLIALAIASAATLSAADSLSQAASRRGIRIGAAVQSGYIASDAAYAATLAREYSMIEPEYEMLWSAIHPSPAGYNFSGADRLVDYAQRNHIPLRADHLVWHSSLPAYLSGLGPDALKQALQSHIAFVAGRYAGKVYSWEVVNEAVDPSGTKLRDSIWNNQPGIGLSGIAWIEQAFQWAHQADPGARLFYNDYGAEDINAKSDFIYNMVRQMLADGTPIHGVGLQMHLTNNVNYPSAAGLAANIQRLTDLGLEVIVTEMDVRLPVDSSGNASPANLAIQAQLYDRVVSACIKFPRCTAIQTWGITDLHSWIPGTFPGTGAGLPFDRNYQPKSAYTASLAALLNTPPSIEAAGLLNAASYSGGGVAPGEIVTLFNARYGPPALVPLELDAGGKIASSLDGAQLLFDGTAAPVIYAQTGQSSFIVPYSVAGKATTTVQYVYRDAFSNSVTVPVAATAPALFSIDSSGTGPGAILDAAFHLNSAANPARAGDTVLLFATGAGALDAPAPDGGLVAGTLPKPLAPVSVQIGGKDAIVQYAGGAAGLTNGLLQVNVVIPPGLNAGPQPVVLKVGAAASPATVTVAIASN